MRLWEISALFIAEGRPHVFVTAAPRAEHNDSEHIDGDFALKVRPRVLPFETWKRFCAAFALRPIETHVAPYRWIFRSKSGVSVFTQFDPRVDGRLGRVGIIVAEDEAAENNHGPFGRVRSALAQIADIPKLRVKRTKDQIIEDRMSMLRAIREHDQRTADKRRTQEEHDAIRENLRNSAGKKFRDFKDLTTLKERKP